MGMSTSMISAKSIHHKWFLVDASEKIVGRLASQIASILRGKNQSYFVSHLDVGSYVIVIHADKLAFTGKKEDHKQYWSYTGFPGGERSITPRKVRTESAEKILFSAVKGMLPKGPLGRQMLSKLKVYSGSEHPHSAQQPESLNLIATRRSIL